MSSAYLMQSAPQLNQARPLSSTPSLSRWVPLSQWYWLCMYHICHTCTTKLTQADSSYQYGE